MSLQQFNESKHVSYMIDLLYRSRDQTGDVHFLYEHQGTTVVRIPAHKNVLAIGSTVLNDVFFGLRKLTGDIPTRSNTVTVETFEAFIALLYGKWNSITKDNYVDLLRISQNFDAQFCEAACNEFIRQLDEIDPEIDR